MKKLLHILFLCAVAALPMVGNAQPTYTSSDTSFGTTATNFTAVQTFTGFSSLSDMTWTISNTTGISQITGFNAYVAQWNSGDSTVVGSLTPFGTVNNQIIVGGGGVGNLTFTDSWTAVNPSLTYALLLSYASGDSTLVTSSGFAPGDAFFGSGTAAFANTLSTSGAFLTDLQTPGTAFDLGAGTAFAMSVTGIAATPAPEPATAAAGLAALFVGALVGRRVWQRRKLASTPLAA